MLAGDTAGLALLSSPYAWIGVVKSEEGATLQMYTSPSRRRGFGPRRREPAAVNEPVVSPIAPPDHLWLRVHCNFDTDQAVFSWSADGEKFTQLGDPFTMTFQLTTFQGVRPALFHYNTSGQPGGYVDFDNYMVDEPRARGIEREIPIGKTIVLTSGADGSFLAADLESSTLVNISRPATTSRPMRSSKSSTSAWGVWRSRRQWQGRLGRKPRERRPQGPWRCRAERRGDLPVDQSDARRHDAHVADESSLSRDQAQPSGPVTATATGPTRLARAALFKWKEALGNVPTPPIATPLKWKSSGVLVRPISDETHKIVSVKDPTVVHYDGLWHIYATAYSTSARTWSMVYLNFKDWSDAPNAKLTYIDVNPNLTRVSLCPASVLLHAAQEVVLDLSVAAAAVLHDRRHLQAGNLDRAAELL